MTVYDVCIIFGSVVSSLAPADHRISGFIRYLDSRHNDRMKLAEIAMERINVPEATVR